ncbi:mitochondrial glycoprotein [Hirsutella rhossiliensis]|uniref:Mitochondrial glycoprotein n=1 Tax=Hirsutella rhossiliensis TaxID=111463 RepID=A0A9P8N3V1_9HYPO|nr:mitochondrial glycoprotein [Hirsutella rhossiliensis]KAH0965471.1 mitochondrial glycoprotein [Hirsutella rhossiliensis]
MLSLRSAARAVPRVLGRAAAAPLRSSATARPSISATAAALRQPARAAFSATAGRRAHVAESTDELSAKLESELQIEEDLKANEQQPASIKDFLDNCPFELQDTPGQEVVKLVRSFNDEKITVSFSISDITNYDPFNEDPALEEDEDLSDEALQNPNQQGGVPAKGGARSAAAEEQMEDDMDEDDLGEGAVAPINLTVVVEKPGKTKGALSVEATATDGNIVVENVFYYDDAAMARLDSPDAAQRRADVYPGPPFGSLDEDLQVLVERFLEERGVTQAMATFVPDYVDAKEQSEYLRWLSNVKAFVDA